MNNYIIGFRYSDVLKKKYKLSDSKNKNDFLYFM